MKKLIKTIFLLMVVAAVGLVVLKAVRRQDKPSAEVSEGQITDVKTMARLCTIELRNEVPVQDTINNKLVVAIQKQKTTVSFDVEALQVDTAGENIKVILPPEIIEIEEDASMDNAWVPIDVKILERSIVAFFMPEEIDDKEEKALKKKILKKSRKLLYASGKVERARKDAAIYLKELMEMVYDKPV